MQVKHLFGKTCIGKGTGSAFKGEGLQSNGLKAVLDTGVVFGRTCGAASTTLPREKTFRKTHTNYKENMQNIQS